MQNNEVLKIGAPLIAMGGVWVAQKALAAVYRASTGNDAPKADNLDAPVSRVIVYASATAVVGAVVTVAINRVIGKMAQPAESY
ncbi:DUF4235 domain-containing protein [Candidatus Nanopelagicales bacterium]|nr:DUF4235 domain-containing protein [Candidatus Nanopelagicales bacterium]